jgi:hypothetical protein
MVRITQAVSSRLERSSGISTEDLSGCTRERDFTNLLDLKHKHHHTFLKNLRQHVGYFFNWKELRGSPVVRGRFADSFLSLYGTEYRGSKNREKYIMPDSVARGDEIRYPDDAAE